LLNAFLAARLKPRPEFAHLREQSALECGGLTPPYGLPFVLYRPRFRRPSFRLTLSSHPSSCRAQHRLPKSAGRDAPQGGVKPPHSKAHHSVIIACYHSLDDAFAPEGGRSEQYETDFFQAAMNEMGE